MTDQQPHTPTTDLVCSVYVQHMTRHGDTSMKRIEDGFDRWLATVEAAAEQRGKEAGWDEGYWQGVDDELISASNIGIAGFGMKVQPNRVNPYRADQMEAGDD